MNLRGFKIKTALIIFVVVVGCGLGMQYLYQQAQVIAPLTKQLQELPGVAEVYLTKGSLNNRSRTLVNLTIEKEVPLTLVFSQVRQTLEKTSGEFAIQLEDSADLKLWRLFEKIQLVTEEAIMTGEFSSLERRVRDLAESQGVAWDLALDRDYVYLRLTSDTNTLQRVVNRGIEDGKIIICTEGGV